MERLIQMGKELGFEGKAFQVFVKAERFADMELERDKLAQQSRDREIEREDKSAQEARIVAEKEKEIQLAKFVVEEV